MGRRRTPTNDDSTDSVQDENKERIQAIHNVSLDRRETSTKCTIHLYRRTSIRSRAKVGYDHLLSSYLFRHRLCPPSYLSGTYLRRPAKLRQHRKPDKIRILYHLFLWSNGKCHFAGRSRKSRISSLVLLPRLCPPS